MTFNAVAMMLLCTAATVRAADWPTYRGDFRRSGATEEVIDAAALKRVGEVDLGRAPAPPWHGPAKVDAFRNMPALGDMRNYDRAFGLAVVGRRFLVGSSADDTLRCFELPAAKQVWSFTAGGPVRLAPTVVDGNVYFGADDGYAYCLNHADGTLRWKVRAATADRRIVINGRIASLWPVRTGVVVTDGKAYFAAGMLPWESTYFCAVDAATGKVDGDGCFRREFAGWPGARLDGETAKALTGKAGLTPEGAMVLYKDRLLVPQGRVAPMLYSRTDGATLDNAPGPGGCFAMLTDDNQWLFAPGNRQGYLCGADAESGAGGLIFDGMSAVVDADTMYYLTVNAVTAVARGQWAIRGRGKRNPAAKWSQPVPDAGALVRAGGTIFVGGRNTIEAFAAADGSRIWRAAVKGKVYELVVANGWLLAGTDAGGIYCFSDKAAGETSTPRTIQAPAGGTDAPARGPYVSFTSPTSATVRWHTAEPVATEAFWSDSLATRSSGGGNAASEHTVELTGLTRNGLYQVVIPTGKGAYMQFELDTYFNFTAPAVNEGIQALADGAEQDAAAAKSVLAAGVPTRGLCLVLGSGDGRLAYALARQSELSVVGVETDPAGVAASRMALLESGAYGSRVSVVHVESLDSVPIVRGCANLIVVDAGSRVPESELRRLLAPGGVAVLGGGEKFIQPPAQDAGVWTHEYGLPDNTAFGGEGLGGARKIDDLAVRWVGRPGPRFQTDRSGRKPSPLAVGGRLFMQGRERIAALDAYNGTVLWSLEMPGAGTRMNVPADCSNWCADRSSLYLAVRDHCCQIDAATGRVLRSLPVVPGVRDGEAYHWGYVARVGGLLLGTSVSADAPFSSFWGDDGWYDGWEANKVCSDTLFALNPATGETAWTYRRGRIIHSSIAADDRHIYFVESRHAAVIAAPSSRIASQALWSDTFIVALNAMSGKVLWESPYESPGWPGIFYLVAAGDRLVVGTNVKRDGQQNSMYFAMGFKNPGGEKLWSVSWDGQGHHGSHMSHPAVVGGKVYMRPKVLDLKDGAEAAGQMPPGGCGTYAMSRHAAFYRSSTLEMWPLSGEAPTSWWRLRPDCWISSIPAAGLLLSPEGGGGCSCGSWLECSIAFGPR